MLEMIGEGASLRQACIKQGFAHAEALRVIRADDAPDGLAYQYAQAREANGDYYADQVTTIATLTVNGKLKADAARVAIDAHKWRAGQMAPKVWGIKATTQLTGADGGAVKIETTANVTFLDIARRMERLAGGGATDARPADGVAGDGAVEPTHA